MAPFGTPPEPEVEQNGCAAFSQVKFPEEAKKAALKLPSEAAAYALKLLEASFSPANHVLLSG